MHRSMVNAAVDPQPNETGVGFSYGDKRDYIDDEDGVGEDLYQFLQVRRSKLFYPSNAPISC